VLAVLAVTACDREEPAPPQEVVRAIKTMTATEVASGRVRKFSGVVQATDTSSLSFRVPGNVKSVKADLGDRVKKSQVLAVLDTAPYQLNVEAAQAELKDTEAVLKEKATSVERQRALFNKGWVSKAALDQAVSGFESAKSKVEFARAKLNIVRRDLSHTTLKAPFDGFIATKTVDPFVEVASGQVVFEVHAEGALEVQVDIPENLISQIKVGVPAQASYPTLPNMSSEGRVTQVGKSARTANAFPVKVGLTDPPAELRPGMTARVAFVFDQGDERVAYLVPLSAIAPGEEPGHGYVFVFDPETSTVVKTPIRGRAGRDNLVVIYEGLQAGDVIAVAGVSFLVDGQKVKLLEK
jgi:RND family efflux transporter MFP subunit